jgi:GNAT superfamily N-acetyltransferase
MARYLTIDENLRAAMRCYAKATPIGEVREYPGVVLASSGVNYSVFNSAMLTGPTSTATLDLALNHAEIFFASRRVGWSLWICDELLSAPLRRKAVDTLRDRGLRLVASPPGMWTDRIAETGRGTAGIDCRVVDDDRTRRHFADIASVVFALPHAISRDIYGGQPIWNSGMTGYVGYFGRKPVSVAVTVVAAGAVGVYSVGTLPQHRRCGYAETLMRHALDDARRATGLEVTILQSTKQGQRLYMQMGYQLATSFSVYVYEPCGGLR